MIRVLFLAATLIVLTLFAALPVRAECYSRDVLAGYLKAEHGLSLHSWGLTDSGDMAELFLSPRGHWAVITTTPRRCATVAMPHKERGRLWAPPKQNHALPDALALVPGVPG